MNENTNINSSSEHSVPASLAKKRLDQAVAELCPQYSRSQLQKWIKSGDIRLNGEIATAKTKVWEGDSIKVDAVPQEQVEYEPEAISLNIIHEDESLLVINKPANLVVHPAAGNWSGTLVNALLHHDENLRNLPRAGIVHRLDKDTTGLMVVAKTLESHQSLVAQLQERSVKREYLALVHGHVIAGSTIEGNIGRHPVDRKKMAVVDGGKHAVTHYRIEEKLPNHTLLRVNLETGRTHQIRVHLSWRNMPIIGDKTYGGRLRIPAGITEEVKQAINRFPRQALHATQLGLLHPETGEMCQWQAKIPADMQNLLEILR
jgi:23S rRNA pseudouridine1911/1915/1917 synthase